MRQMLLFIVAMLLFGCNKPVKEQKESVEPIVVEIAEFHVSVEHFYKCRWYVTFTNDGYKTKNSIKLAFDISSSTLGERVCFQEDLFDTQEEAIFFAKRFTTYEKCLQYNDSVKAKYEEMLAYRKQHPIVKVSIDSECSNSVKKVVVY